MAFTGIYKYFTRSVQEINKITLRVMTSNPPQGKVLSFKIVGVVILYPVKKGINIVIFRLDYSRGSSTEGGMEISEFYNTSNHETTFT